MQCAQRAGDTCSREKGEQTCMSALASLVRCLPPQPIRGWGVRGWGVRTTTGRWGLHERRDSTSSGRHVRRPPSLPTLYQSSHFSSHGCLDSCSEGGVLSADDSRAHSRRGVGRIGSDAAQHQLLLLRCRLRRRLRLRLRLRRPPPASAARPAVASMKGVATESAGASPTVNANSLRRRLVNRCLQVHCSATYTRRCFR